VDALFMSARLEDFEANANVTALEKRTNIEDCIKVAAALNTCFELGKNVRVIGSSIANWVTVPFTVCGMGTVRFPIDGSILPMSIILFDKL
jgi:hypothetical protein